MTESDIRSDIKARLPHFFRGSSEVLLVEEMEVCSGRARADMAVISDQLIGIEIKGSRDNVDRLPNQVDHYARCFDHVVLVVHENLAEDAIRLIPLWWGVVVGSERNGSNYYRLKRHPSQNYFVDVDAVLALLWKEEIESLFLEFLHLAPPGRASKRKLREQLLAKVSPV